MLHRSALAVIACFVALGTVVVPPSAQAKVIAVTETLDDEPAIDNGACSLREAILAANQDTPRDACPAGNGADVITVPAGSYRLDPSRGRLQIVQDDVEIRGAGAGITEIVGNLPGEATYNDNIFLIGGVGDVTIDSLTVRGGDDPLNGGGIFFSGSGHLAVLSSEVTDNRATNFGGGINIAGAGAVTLESSVVAGNRANFGGGINHNGAGGLSIIASTVTRNIANDFGGGIRAADERVLSVRDSEISHNIADSGDGAGLQLNADVVTTIEDSSITANDADGDGGGIWNDGNLTVTSSTISENIADGFGSGIRNLGELTVATSAIDRNDTDGFTPPSLTGGGVSNDGGDVVIEGSSVSGNTSELVGGLHNTGAGSMTLNDVTVNGNRGISEVGGVTNGPFATFTASRSAISSNRAVLRSGGISNFGEMLLTDSVVANNITTGSASTDAGGIFNQGLLLLTATAVTNNTAANHGGGIHNSSADASVRLERSAVTHNRAGGATGSADGGGIHNTTGARLTLERSTVSSNRADRHGGGIFSDSTDFVVIRESTIAGNRADEDLSLGGDGGGIAVVTGSPLIRASIVANNVDRSGEAPDCSGTVTSHGNNVIFNDQGCTGLTGVAVGDIEADPQLGPLANNGGTTETHAIAETSPARDRVPDDHFACNSTLDQRGVKRPDGPGCDSGSYELAFCRGVIVNVVGTSGRDRLEGSEGPDGVLAYGGRDIIKTYGGDDHICAGGGNDRISAGGGRDLLHGGGGNDRCIGGGGRDRFRACESIRQ